MKQNDILSKIDRRSGMTVPEGYFDDFSARMVASLPQQEWERGEGQQAVSQQSRRTTWQFIRPYVYMAAMFVGVWLMMQMFDHMRPASTFSIDTNPVLAEAIGNDAFINEYFLDSADSDELIDDIWTDDK